MKYQTYHVITTPNNTQPTATQCIRQATKHLHAELEATDVAQVLMSEGLTLVRYMNILATWASAWQALECRVWSSLWATQISRLLPARRSELAKVDLSVLGALLQANSATLQPCRPTEKPLLAPLACNPPELLGHCYVMQGSSLGGAVIAKHLQATLGLPDDKGHSFFLQDKAGVPSWTHWCREVDVILQNHADIQSAHQGAIQAYQFLIERFKRMTP